MGKSRRKVRKNPVGKKTRPAEHHQSIYSGDIPPRRRKVQKVETLAKADDQSID